MAYVLGFLYADGHLEDSAYIRGKYIHVINTDRDRIEIIRDLLGSEHAILERDKGGNYKRAYLLRIGSHTLYNRLFEIGMTPRKSLTMRFPAVPQKYLNSFVRGYFDGDGCVFLEKYYGTDHSHATKRMRTIFTSGSRRFLWTLNDQLIKHAGIRKFYLHAHSKKGAYQLRYSTESSVKLFTFMYGLSASRGLYLRRKYDIFMQYFKERPAWVDVHVCRILKRL
ncbi:hypothetical protein A3A40_01350 [Candidatus Kaiserbacteria bacterium RIFCSPLOWO2_01_FULL_54_20]|uniref:DOD-type homing endonuclease domain-containing protein n=1 Tax=Candidatus Kaiserbacteria bacterium RIFCSPLOWO2_01_FULL_54_20 TaxID=1798513 RepID=A0A1F6EK41_9BACT|nr:MAG: hypothetical protein A3A40_01350 [Candidatus Kaiserbacteria bacterium RIFCSPLOWO2_01_FULL_54_20]